MIELERDGIDTELTPPISIARPAIQSIPLVFCSPHSGRVYPRAFLQASRLSPLVLRRSEDAFVDRLFASAVGHGAPLLSALFPRAYLDVNREPLELDPRLIDGPMPSAANTQSARVAGGLGTIPRLVADGEDIYASRMPVAVALQRIERLYHPFHQALAGLMRDTHRNFGTALLVDCHSMPSTSVGNTPSQRPHFVIGDRFGTSCAPEITRVVCRNLTAMGHDVHVNRPYAGGFITEHYGQPHARMHAIQIEINRSLYLDEAALEPKADFYRFAAVIESLVAALAVFSGTWVRPNPFRSAAE